MLFCPETFLFGLSYRASLANFLKQRDSKDPEKLGNEREIETVSGRVKKRERQLEYQGGKERGREGGSENKEKWL